MGAPQYEQAGADVAGSGTTNTIPRWTGPTTLGDSGLIDDGSVIYTTARNAAFGSTSSAGYRARVLAAAGAGSAFGLRIDAGTNSTDYALRIANQATTSDYLAVRGDGNVGIGTASPYARASVRGGSNDGIGVWSTAVTTAGSPIGGSLFLGDANFYNAGFYNQAPGLSAVFDVSTSVAAALAFYTYSGTNRIERARIDSSGNVGIGTASPGARLHVSDNSSIPVIVQSSGSTDSYLRFINTSNNLGYIGYVGTNLYLAPNNGAGNVGIGTASPASKLEIATGTAGAQQLRLSNSASTTNYWDIGRDNATTGDLIFRTNVAARVTMTNTGNMSLQTTAAVFDASGTQQGLKLPATPGNADTQTLDCYQETTWTPTLAGFGGTNPTVTASYTRVGRLVTLTVRIAPTGGAQYSGTLLTTTLTVPTGMSPAANTGAASPFMDWNIADLGTVTVWNNGLIYLPTFALTTAETVFTVTYRV